MTHPTPAAAVAALATLTALVAGCAAAPTPALTGCGGRIGFMGALSGGNAGIVIPAFNGATLAFKQFQADNTHCEITLQEFDTEGDPAKAAPVANKIVADKTFLGVIGGAFSGETRQTKATYDAGNLTMISPSATATDLTTENPAKVFHRVVGHDETQGAAIGKYLTDILKAERAYVVDDGTAYGAPLADKVTETAGNVITGRDTVQEKQTDFAATISKIKAANVDAVFYAGYANEAAPFLKQLRSAGVKAPFVGGDGLYGSHFQLTAGRAAEGAVVTCPCQPPGTAAGFAAAYAAAYGEAPGAYAAEGYDAATIFLKAIKAGNTTREKVEAFVDNYDEDGVTKHIKFDAKGDVDEDQVVIWAYTVSGQQLVPLVPIQ